MRDYATVRPSFWTGDTGRELRGDADAQRVAFYVMTCGSNNIAGLYYLPLPLICHDIGIDAEAAREALQRLSQADFCHYDEPSSYVWVVNGARESIGETPNPADNRVVGVVRELDKHKKSPFFGAFRGRYAPIFGGSADARPQAAAEPHRSPSPGGGGSGSGSGSGSRTGAGDRARARTTGIRPASAEAQTQSAAELGADDDDNQALTPALLGEVFAETWARVRSTGRPKLPAPEQLEQFTTRVVETASARSVPPLTLVRTALEQWAGSELNAREMRTPYACFETAWDETVDVVAPAAAALHVDSPTKRLDEMRASMRALNGGAR